MTKKHTEIFQKFQKCIDGAADYWNQADRLSVIEQRERSQQMIYGISFAALHCLTGDEYQELVAYIHEKGFNH